MDVVAAEVQDAVQGDVVGVATKAASSEGQIPHH